MTQNLYHDEALIKSVTYSGRNGHRISLECDPEAWERLKGTEGARVAMVLVPIAEDGTPDADKLSKAPEKPDRPKEQWDDMPASKQAAIRCQDDAFQTWIAPSDNVPTQDLAAQMVRRHCKVTSRSELTASNPDALKIWHTIDDQFRAHAGLARRPSR